MRARRLWIRTARAALLTWLAAAGVAGAEPPQKEIWPEVDTWLRLSPAWRVSVFVPISKNLETYYREGNLILQSDYSWGETNRTRRLIDEDRAQAMDVWLLRGSIVPYVSVEPYYDSRYETVNRVRLITGASVAWSRRTAIETNVTYQYDSRSSTKELFALNVILHVFFDASRTP
jgi:hypothetical protein